ncbi:hypothetical protein L0Y46_04380, partial [bacterium]|nr:hypothetical protein [bacterium]
MIISKRALIGFIAGGGIFSFLLFPVKTDAQVCATGPTPQFSQDLIDLAFEEELLRGYYGNYGRGTEDAIPIPTGVALTRNQTAAMYLAIVARIDPTAKSSYGEPVTDRVAEQIHYFLQGSSNLKGSHDVYNPGHQDSF